MSALITCTSCQHDWLKPTAGSLSKVWTQPGCCSKKGCRVSAPDDADSPMSPWAHRAGTCPSDDNAAVNLARWEEPATAVGPVGAAVKRGADRKTGPRPAGGREARKGRSHTAAEQPRDGVQVA